MTNLELPLFQASAEDEKVKEFLYLLGHYGRLTRKQISEIKGWSEREIRALAEAAGAEVIRGQKGFILTRDADLEEASNTANAFLAQSEKMRLYGLALKKRIHGRVG